MQRARYIWHFQNCATWSHTCTLALSGFGGILVLFQIAAQTGASVTCWWPDWHVWHKIRAWGDNVVFGLGWASWVRRFIYMLNEGQCSKGRVHIGFCTKQCLGSGGANPPWLPIVAHSCPSHWGFYYALCTILHIYTMHMVAPHPHRGFPASVQSAPAKCLHFVKFGLLVRLNIKGYRLCGSNKSETHDHLQSHWNLFSTTNWSKGSQRVARSS